MLHKVQLPRYDTYASAADYSRQPECWAYGALFSRLPTRVHSSHFFYRDPCATSRPRKFRRQSHDTIDTSRRFESVNPKHTSTRQFPITPLSGAAGCRKYEYRA